MDTLDPRDKLLSEYYLTLGMEAAERVRSELGILPLPQRCETMSSYFNRVSLLSKRAWRSQLPDLVDSGDDHAPQPKSKRALSFMDRLLQAFLADWHESYYLCHFYSSGVLAGRPAQLCKQIRNFVGRTLKFLEKKGRLLLYVTRLRLGKGIDGVTIRGLSVESRRACVVRFVRCLLVDWPNILQRYSRYR